MSNNRILTGTTQKSIWPLSKQCRKLKESVVTGEKEERNRRRVGGRGEKKVERKSGVDGPVMMMRDGLLEY